MAALSLYEKVTKITHIYLGPAADRFIARQVTNHLGKNPKEITKTDLVSLIDWIGVAVSLITDDEAVIERYLNDLRNLTKPTKGKRKAN